MSQGDSLSVNLLPKQPSAMSQLPEMQASNRFKGYELTASGHLAKDYGNEVVCIIVPTANNKLEYMIFCHRMPQLRASEQYASIREAIEAAEKMMLERGLIVSVNEPPTQPIPLANTAYSYPSYHRDYQSRALQRSGPGFSAVVSGSKERGYSFAIIIADEPTVSQPPTLLKDEADAVSACNAVLKEKRLIN